MFKKTTYLAGASLLAMGILFGRDAVSYVSTSAGWVKDSVKDSVPIEFEIERARNLLSSLEPEIRQNMQAIAREEVQVERLAKQIAKLTDRQGRDREQLVRLKGDVEEGHSVYFYSGRRYTDGQVRIDLASRLNRAKTNDATLTSLDKVMTARSRGLSAARQKLEQMLSAKRQLVVDIQNLEAQLKMVNVAKAASDFQFDDSRLARTEKLISDIRTRLEVEERMLDVEVNFHDEIPLDVESDEDVVQQVAKYFGELTPEDVKVADNH
jgi:chromosome segregation ATPase